MGKTKALPALYITLAQMGFSVGDGRVHTGVVLCNQPICQKATLGRQAKILLLRHAYSFPAWYLYVSISEGFVKYTAASIFHL